MNPRKILIKLATTFFIFLLLWGIFYWQSKEEKGKLVVNFFDVGQGDSILIKTPNNQKILIDGGPDNGVLAKLGRSLPFYDKEIDLMILTHPHSDHLVGLVEVLKRYKVKKIISTGVIHTTPEYLAWLEEIKEQKIPLEIAIAGQVLDFGNETKMEILYPLENLAGQSVDDLNNTSIVSKLTFKDNSFLFMGDAEATAEEKIIASGADLKADILKIGHHGSKNATSENFLEKVDPQSAVISVGAKNKFGHPSGLVVNRLKREGTEILRTDIEGDIKFLGDGEAFVKAY
ncbi:MAG TPA: ComEC/Rec2 family competence protein [Patescibacteria group bacterium]|nr:ComEC/Rec2 family competence protein [Patescibacteria group bacterium]